LKDVSLLMEKTRTFLNGLDLIPRQNSRFDSVLLALLSKSIVLTESIVVLVSHDFDDEAFGLCRSCIELELTLRYLTNADTDERCKRYIRYFAKANSEWLRLIARYYPGMTLSRRSDAKELAEFAALYKDPNRWSEQGHGLKYFASEIDTFETTADGSPLNESFYHEVLYKWMSYYVHTTESCLDKHVTLPGRTYAVHPGQGTSTLGEHALRVSYQFVRLNLLRILRCLNMDHPEELMARYEDVIKRRTSPDS
jgi:hypothetical protein